MVVTHGNCLVCDEGDGEDMDISPGCSVTEELRTVEQTCTMSIACDQQSHTLTEDFTSDSTFLNTLAKLQQAVQQVTVDNISSSKAVPSSVLSLLATLPSLICKLKTASEPQLSTGSSTQRRAADQQQITLQGEPFDEAVS